MIILYYIILMIAGSRPEEDVVPGAAWRRPFDRTKKGASKPTVYMFPNCPSMFIQKLQTTAANKQRNMFLYTGNCGKG